jgi:regulatory protein
LSDFVLEFNALEVQLAKRSALKRLSMQAMLSNRLIEFLKIRLVSNRAIEIVLQELNESGFINDKSYVDSFVRVQKARCLGPRAIAQKLALKGIKQNQSLKNLEAYQPEDQKLAISHLLKTRYASRNLKDPRDKQRTIAALARRGFDFSLIISLVK